MWFAGFSEAKVTCSLCGNAVRFDRISSVVLVPLGWVDEGKSWGCVWCPVGIAAMMEQRGPGQLPVCCP